VSPYDNSWLSSAFLKGTEDKSNYALVTSAGVIQPVLAAPELEKGKKGPLALAS
jgi:hypothetical protein